MMNPWFPLETVLELRQQEEDAARAKCATSRASLREGEDGREAVARRLEEGRSAFRTEALKVLPVDRLQSLRQGLQDTEETLGIATGTLKQAEKVSADRIADFLEALRCRRALSILKKRQRARRAKQTRNREQRVVEDIVAARITRKLT